MIDVRWVFKLFSSGDVHDPTVTKGKLVCQTSLEPAVGNEVICMWGRGRVLEVRPEKQQVVVRLSSWRLAKASWVTCYLSTSAVQVVCGKKVYEMSVDEKVLYAQAIKEEGSRQFAVKDYEGALLIYARAIENMSYAREEPKKALVDVVLLSITCSNNAATCCSLLEQWDEAASFARNALVLIMSLESKEKNESRRKRMLHAMLSELGYMDSKLFGEWRVKSLLTIAKAFAESKKYEEALGMIKEARLVIDKYTAQEYVKQPALLGSIKILRANEKQARKLKKLCKERLKENRKEEQKQQIDALYRSPATTPTVAGLDEPHHFHFKSPETTRVLNRALCTLSPCESVDSSESSSDNYSVATLLTDSPPKNGKAAASTKDVPSLGVAAASSWHLDTRTLAGIALVTGGIGLAIMGMGLTSTLRGSK